MMKFITEVYLRNLYRKEPFSVYELQEGQHLTPGAIEYLSDKRVKVNYNALEASKKSCNNNLYKNKLYFKLKLIEAQFLATSSEIIKEDIVLAQNIVRLNRKISNIREVVSGTGILESINCKECNGMNSLNLTTELDDCLEITEFHMQLEKSNAILKINILRCAMQELQFEIINTYENNDDILKNRIIENVNLIINTLSQMICSAVGTKECQRKK